MMEPFLYQWPSLDFLSIGFTIGLKIVAFKNKFESFNQNKCQRSSIRFGLFVCLFVCLRLYKVDKFPVIPGFNQYLTMWINFLAQGYFRFGNWLFFLRL